MVNRSRPECGKCVLLNAGITYLLVTFRLSPNVIPFGRLYEHVMYFSSCLIHLRCVWAIAYVLQTVKYLAHGFDLFSVLLCSRFPQFLFCHPHSYLPMCTYMCTCTHIILEHLTAPVDQKWEHRLASSLFQDVHRLQSKCQLGLGSHQKTQVGKNTLLRSHSCWWDSLPHYLLPKRYHHFLDMKISHSLSRSICNFSHDYSRKMLPYC